MTSIPYKSEDYLSTPTIIQNCYANPQSNNSVEMWINFLSNLIWPLFFILIILVFREKISQLLSSINDKIKNASEITINGSGLEIVDSQIQAVEEKVGIDYSQVNPIALSLWQSEQTYIYKEHNYYGLFRINPRAAVLDYWVVFENFLYEMADEVKDKKKNSILKIQDTLLSRQLITKDENSAISQMRALRNDLAHSLIEITSVEASRYIRSGIALMNTITERVNRS